MGSPCVQLPFLLPAGSSITSASWRLVCAAAWAPSALQWVADQLGEEVDLNRTAIAGHSRGGKTAALLFSSEWCSYVLRGERLDGGRLASR